MSSASPLFAYGSMHEGGVGVRMLVLGLFTLKVKGQVSSFWRRLSLLER